MGWFKETLKRLSQGLGLQDSDRKREELAAAEDLEALAYAEDRQRVIQERRNALDSPASFQAASNQQACPETSRLLAPPRAEVESARLTTCHGQASWTSTGGRPCARTCPGGPWWPPSCAGRMTRDAGCARNWRWSRCRTEPPGASTTRPSADGSASPQPKPPARHPPTAPEPEQSWPAPGRPSTSAWPPSRTSTCTRKASSCWRQDAGGGRWGERGGGEGGEGARAGGTGGRRGPRSANPACFPGDSCER